jgi:hypothetical protein
LFNQILLTVCTKKGLLHFKPTGPGLAIIKGKKIVHIYRESINWSFFALFPE